MSTEHGQAALLPFQLTVKLKEDLIAIRIIPSMTVGYRINLLNLVATVVKRLPPKHVQIEQGYRQGKTANVYY